MINQHATLVAKVGASVLRDIEGLNPSDVGFERAECCGPLPAKLPGSFESLLHHVFVSTSVEPTQWDKTCGNVPHYEATRKAMKALPQATATAYFDASAPQPSALLFKYMVDSASVSITQYSGGDWSATDGVVKPWDAKGVVAADRSEETFVFVCSHRNRDDRCGYCGPMLVDLLRKAVADTMASERRELVHVLPCSHIGGHVYAGNVLVYSQKGGVCFGCFCPSDISALVASIDLRGGVPEQLAAKVRGTMGPGRGSEKTSSQSSM